MHGIEFRFILNAEFGKWVLVAAAIFVNHLLYRTKKDQGKIDYQALTQLLFSFSMIILFAACSQEWYYQSEYKKAPFEYPVGQLIIFAIFNLIFLPEFIKPKGKIIEFLSWVLLLSGSVICCVAICDNPFPKPAFMNISFAVILAFLVIMLIYQIRYRLISKVGSQILYIALISLFLLAIAFQWAFNCGDINNLQERKFFRGDILIGSPPTRSPGRSGPSCRPQTCG
jgi:hypothetical protein